MVWDMKSLNISATLNIFRVLAKPSLCLPHATVSTFNDLPVPLGRAFDGLRKGSVNIRAVVLDKDDCFARPNENEVYEPYKERFSALHKEYSASLLIVSNTAGSSSDPSLSQSAALTSATGVSVLAHSVKKPSCGPEIMTYFRAQKGLEDIKPDEVAIVGDRLLTDICLANKMGSWGIWVKHGIVPLKEKSLSSSLALNNIYNPSFYVVGLKCRYLEALLNKTGVQVLHKSWVSLIRITEKLWPKETVHDEKPKTP